MAGETSSTVFKDLVNSPVGIIAEYIVNRLAMKSGFKPLKEFISEIQTGKTPPMNNPEYYSSKDMEWIKPSDIGFEKYITASDWISNIAIKAKKATIYKPNTILIICIGGGIGRLGIVNKLCSSNQQITGVLFKDNVFAEYAYYFFLSRYKIFEQNSSKSTLPIINQKGLGNLDFLCPQLDDQKEIVKYLDYCKECLFENIYPINSRFNVESEVLNFAIRAFKAYYTQKVLLFEYQNQLTKLEKLNQAILKESVQGKLLPQDPNDEPASELLKRIKFEKAKSGKKEKSLPSIKLEEIPFEIPENWIWCRLGEMCSKIGSGSTPKGSNYSKTGYPFFRSQNIYDDGLVYDDIKFVSDEVQKQMNGTVVFANDILLNITGGSLGRCALVPNDFKEGNVSQHVCIIRPLQVDVNYFHKIVLSPYFQRFVFSSTTGAGREGLPKYNLEQFAIPLPPLSEQKRIVVEIEKQLAKTKQLKEHIIANQQATEKLIKALLHQAFEVNE
jgi:type I restriction enzyme S subunit